MKTLLSSALIMGTVAIGSLAQVAPAEALVFGFQNIPSDTSTGDGIFEQFSMDVTEIANNQVLFKFGNAGPTSSFISQVYFDGYSGLLTFAGFQSTTGVNFTASNVTPPNLPQGNNLNPNFQQDFRVGSVQQGSNQDGVDPGQTLNMIFDGNYNNVIAALQNANLRVGLHVQGINGGGSDAYVNSTTPVPTPALVPAAIGAGLTLLRKKKQEDEAAQDA